MRRILALLVSFAAIAENVADRSFPLRLLVLWALRRAEAVAADYVLEVSGAPLPAVEAGGTDQAEALRLAACFRMLAAALGALLPVGFVRRQARRASTRGDVLPSLACFLAGWTIAATDTS